MARRPRKKIAIGPRRTPQQKAQLLADIQTEFLRDTHIDDIAEKFGIHKSTIYRWWPRTTDIHSEKFSDFFASIIDINSVICNIFKLEELDKNCQIENMIKFIVWVRWPKNHRNHWLGVVRCISAYMRDQLGPITINKIDDECSELLLKYLRADLIDLMFSIESPFPVDFEIVTNGTEYNDDIDFAAKLINLMLQGHLVFDGKNHAVSLNLISLLIEKGFFGAKWKMSRTTFLKMWSARSSSLPFMFVERYHSGLDFSIDPKRSNFKEMLDDLISQPEQIKNYLAHCKWAIAHLRGQLDPRALRRISFPEFPAELVPLEASSSLLKQSELMQIHAIIDPSKILR